MKLLRTLAAIVLSGALIGLAGGFFLIALRAAAPARLALVSAAQEHSIPAWLGGILTGLAGASIAAGLAYRFAPGSPQMSVPMKHAPPAKRTSDLGALAVNFAGTGLAVGAGLALGPERPAIQMGASVGRLISRLLGIGPGDREILMAAAGGAGIAAVFGSPLGCAAYTVEAVIGRATYRISAIALVIGGVAVAVTRLILGRSVNYIVRPLTPVTSPNLLLCLLLGCLLAVLAAFHVRLIMGCARLARRLSLPPLSRAGMIGGGIGLLAWFAPTFVGTGDLLTQQILGGRVALPALAVIFLVRFLLGPISLTAGTPGGYFTPVLLLGASVGGLFGGLANLALPAAHVSPTAFALIGMAVALSSVANAPFTGILLVMETTGVFSLVLPMIIAVGCTVVVDRILRKPTLSHGLEVALGQVPPSPER